MSAKIVSIATSGDNVIALDEGGVIFTGILIDGVLKWNGIAQDPHSPGTLGVIESTV